jgi:pilus assembly protein CpaC
MCTRIVGRRFFATLFWAAMTSLTSLAVNAPAQDSDPPLVHKVSGVTERLEMTVNSSRILSTDYKVPQVQVSNPEIVAATPISPKDIQLHAKKTGITQVNLWDDKNQIHAIDVIVYGDVKELTNVLKSNFPEASVIVQPTSGSVILKGYVDKPESVSRIMTIAQDYYPKVINNITVGGAQQVMLHVKVMEVSRTKLRELGFDFADVSGDIASGGLRSSISGLLPGYTTNSSAVGGHNFSVGETVSFGIVDGNNSFFGILAALQRNNIVKILAEPTLVTVSGRPAYFQSGGEIPILIPQGLGNVSVQFRPFGTQVDFVPIVLGEGKLRLEVRPRVSEIDRSLSVVLSGSEIPGFRTRQVDTGVEMRVGQTLALAGLIQSRIESSKTGLPWISDLPYVGFPFRRVIEQYNEIELLILVRPELAEPLNPEEVPPCGPGQDTMTPGDCDLYMKGFLEVPNPRCMGPRCGERCGTGAPASIPPNGIAEPPGPPEMIIEEVPTPKPTPAVQSSPSSASVRERTPNQTTPRKAAPSVASRTSTHTKGAVPTNGAPSGGSRQAPRYNPPVRNVPPVQLPSAGESNEPGLIGPTGYDVIN